MDSMTFPQVKLYLTRNLARRQMEAAEIEKAMDLPTTNFGNLRSSEKTSMLDSDLPAFGLGHRKKKKKTEA